MSIAIIYGAPTHAILRWTTFGGCINDTNRSHQKIIILLFACLGHKRQLSIELGGPTHASVVIQVAKHETKKKLAFTMKFLF